MNTRIRELTTQILSSRTISQIDRENMSALLRREDLNENDRTLIERIFYGVRHGLLKTVE
ncbi:hypothetical protein [Spirulina sp. 06S082]|uniref:hypothetical protein n=1 Tax=Spirulina sp. 06S082 TaxID=3110248 RepID=UPI002B20AC51|nr:hypothetical protein [Spirulina sp. 06S082]MEA5468876.1 hypothetical protein [Spirulina sp. 06S082]